MARVLVAKGPRPEARRVQMKTSWVATMRPSSQDIVFFFSSRRRHTRLQGDWSSDVCSSDLWCREAITDLTPLTGGTVAEPPSKSSAPSDEILLFAALAGDHRAWNKLTERLEIGRASCRERV